MVTFPAPFPLGYRGRYGLPRRRFAKMDVVRRVSYGLPGESFERMETILSDEARAILQSEGFLTYPASYLGCPEHGKTDFACPTDAHGNCLCTRGTFWTINGVDAKTFERSITSPAITYLFVEKTGEVRKIGEGLPNRILANLRAHYNHGTTKAEPTRCNRLSGNSIARKCRLAGDFVLYLKWEMSKDEAQKTQAKLKSILCGWLDYDQGGTGVPFTF